MDILGRVVAPGLTVGAGYSFNLDIASGIYILNMHELGKSKNVRFDVVR